MRGDRPDETIRPSWQPLRLHVLHYRPLRSSGSSSACSTARSRAGPDFIVGSQKDLTCTFTPADGSRPAETYVGTVSKFGLDVGVTGPTLMRWLVLAPTGNPLPAGSLAGDYVGASAEATAAVGAGANVLVGGSNQTFALQPLSVQAQTGPQPGGRRQQFRLRMAG